MKVRALNSFSDSVHGTHAAGDVFYLPEGADWLRAGLVEVATEPVDIGPDVSGMIDRGVEAPKRKKKG